MHTVRCTFCKGSFDSSKIFFKNPYTFHIVILLQGVYGSKNRHLNQKDRMGGLQKEWETKKKNFKWVRSVPEQRGRQREESKRGVVTDGFGGKKRGESWQMARRSGRRGRG